LIFLFLTKHGAFFFNVSQRFPRKAETIKWFVDTKGISIWSIKNIEPHRVAFALNNDYNLRQDNFKDSSLHNNVFTYSLLLLYFNTTSIQYIQFSRAPAFPFQPPRYSRILFTSNDANIEKKSRNCIVSPLAIYTVEAIIISEHGEN